MWMICHADKHGEYAHDTVGVPQANGALHSVVLTKKISALMIDIAKSVYICIRKFTTANLPSGTMYS